MTKMVCIKRGPWLRIPTGEPVTDAHAPVYNEIVTVVRSLNYRGKTMLVLAEYPSDDPKVPLSFDSRHFRRLDDSEQYRKAEHSEFDFRKLLSPELEDA